MFYLKSIF